MFGWDLPDILPENEEEERMMQEEKARLEEEREAHSQRVMAAYKAKTQNPIPGMAPGEQGEP